MTHGHDEMRVLIAGGDGFCGWPTTLHLSASGYGVAIVDSLVRRAIDAERGCESLTPIRPIAERLEAWRRVSGRQVPFHHIDVAHDYDRLLDLIRSYAPDAIVHFAEQRSAPYSMKSSRHKRLTVSNNINATHNILAAIVESGLPIHLVHLGTMGVYGYGSAGMRIPEGYLRVSVAGDNGAATSQDILYPANPGSIYHMTKAQDQLLFAYYNKNDGVRVTDLHQGIVWGTETPQTRMDEGLINRFDYDGDFGTVLNRFLVQAATGHALTVHGTGGQTRAFIHMENSVRCIELALQHPPRSGERVKIANQMTETHRVHDLAVLVSNLTGAPIEYLENPRCEPDANELHVDNTTLLALGLTPLKLGDALLGEITAIARTYAHRCDLTRIPCRSYWNESRRLAASKREAGPRLPDPSASSDIARHAG